MQNDQYNKITVDFLNLALDIEDEMSKDVYEGYLDRSIWPSRMDEGTFRKITADLEVLIRETEGHMTAFAKLKEKLEHNDKG
jgi:hypothetical protein